MLFDVGRASGTKLCRLLWNTNLVEIKLSSSGRYIEFLYFSVKRQHWYRGVQRQLVFRAPEAVTTAKWRDVLEREQFSSQIVAISGDEAHCVSKW